MPRPIACITDDFDTLRQIPEQTEWVALGDKGVYEQSIKLTEWANKDRKAIWEKVCDKYGGSKDAFDNGTWGFCNWFLGKAWPTTSVMTKAHQYGYHRQDDSYTVWTDTFRMLENAGILPPAEKLRKGSPGS